VTLGNGWIDFSGTGDLSGVEDVNIDAKNASLLFDPAIIEIIDGDPGTANQQDNGINQITDGWLNAQLANNDVYISTFLSTSAQAAQSTLAQSGVTFKQGSSVEWAQNVLAVFAPRITFSGDVEYSGPAIQGGLWLIISDTTDGSLVNGDPFTNRITFTNPAFLNFSSAMTSDFTHFSTGQYHSLMVGYNVAHPLVNDYEIFTSNDFSITVNLNNYTSPGVFFANSDLTLEGPVAPDAIKRVDFSSVDQPPILLQKTFDDANLSEISLWPGGISSTTFPAPETGGSNGGGRTNNTNLPPAAEALNVVDSAIPSDDSFGDSFGPEDDTGSFDSFSSEEGDNSFDSFGPEEINNTNTGNTENSDSNEEDKKNKDDDTNENLREQAGDTTSTRF